MKDKRKKKDRTWAEAARLVRTAPRPPPARPAGPAARPAPARGGGDGHFQPQPPPARRAPALCYSAGVGSPRGPCVCACARGGAQRLSRGAPRPPRPGPPGTLLPVLRCRGSAVPSPRVNLRALGPARLPSLPLRRPLCGNYHSLPAPPPPGISSITLCARSVCPFGVCEFIHFTRACTVCVRHGLVGRVHVG